jgi:hypothetical protein
LQGLLAVVDGLLYIVGALAANADCISEGKVALGSRPLGGQRLSGSNLQGLLEVVNGLFNVIGTLAANAV